MEMFFGLLESSCTFPGELDGVFNFILKSAEKAEVTLIPECIVRYVIVEREKQEILESFSIH